MKPLGLQILEKPVRGQGVTEHGEGRGGGRERGGGRGEIGQGGGDSTEILGKPNEGYHGKQSCSELQGSGTVVHPPQMVRQRVQEQWLCRSMSSEDCEEEGVLYFSSSFQLFAGQIHHSNL